MRFNIFYGLTLFIFLTTGCSGMNWNPTGGVYQPKIYPIQPDLKVRNFQGQGEAVSIKSRPVEVEGMTKIGYSYLRNFYIDQREVNDVTISFLAQELSKRGDSQLSHLLPKL